MGAPHRGRWNDCKCGVREAASTAIEAACEALERCECGMRDVSTHGGMRKRQKMDAG